MEHCPICGVRSNLIPKTKEKEWVIRYWYCDECGMMLDPDFVLRRKKELMSDKFHYSRMGISDDEPKIGILKLLPQNSVGAEVGVSCGNLSQKILSIVQPKELHLIDKWDVRGGKDLATVESRFAKEIDSGKVILAQGDSVEELGDYSDHYFDWIYIDADHRYDAVLNDLRMASRKVKKDGFICGDDYVLDLSKVRFETDVAKAVWDFCFKHGWKIKHLIGKDIHNFILERK